jgi:hypothetical protein
MQRFVFEVQSGQFPELTSIEDVLNDLKAARKAAPGDCADLASGGWTF